MVSRTKLIGMGIVAAVAIGMTGCQSGEFVRWDDSGTPTRVNAKTNEATYKYVYYPDAQVYREPYSGMFWWFQNGAWFEGNELPESLSLDKQKFEFVELDTPKPWTRHVTAGFFGRKSADFKMDPTEITSVDPWSVHE